MVLIAEVLADPLLTFIQAASELVFDIDLGIRTDFEDDRTVSGDGMEHFVDLQEIPGPRTGTEAPRLFNLDFKHATIHLNGIVFDVIPGFRVGLVRHLVSDKSTADSSPVSIPAIVRSAVLEQVVILAVTDGMPLFGTELLDVVNKSPLYLVIAAVDIGEIDVRKMQAELVEEGRIFKSHDVVVIGLHYKYNTIILFRKIYFTFFHEQRISWKPGSASMDWVALSTVDPCLP
jgi:hypothetical protein